MTCIVGTVSDGVARIAGDMMSSAGSNIVALDYTKVIRRSVRILEQEGQSPWRSVPIVLGIAGDARAAQLVQHSSDLPWIGKYEDVMKWIVHKLVPLFRSEILEGTSDDVDRDVEIVLSFRGRLFWIMTNWSAIEVTDHCASGSGRQYAMGALYATKPRRRGPPTPERAVKAVAAAAAYCTSVGGPYTTDSTSTRDWPL